MYLPEWLLSGIASGVVLWAVRWTPREAFWMGAIVAGVAWVAS